MPDIVGQVLGVTGSPTQNGGTKFDVSFSDGNVYSTFKQPVAAKAQSLVGQTVSARIEAKPSRDGSRTFYNLEDIALQGQLPPLAMPLATGTPLGAPGQMNGGGGLFGSAPIQQVNPIDKDRRITRGNAANAVATLFAGTGAVSVDEYLEAVDAVARYIFTGRTGNEPETPQTPQEIAASIPGVQVGPPAEAPQVTW